jgi:TPR repeat protein
MKKYLIAILLIISQLPLFAQKLNSAEETIFRAEATKMVENYYAQLPAVIGKLNDSLLVQEEDDKGIIQNRKTSYGRQFIDLFFDNHDIYVYNDLSPDDDPKRAPGQRVMTIEEYLQEVKKLYGDMKKQKLETSLKSAKVLEVGYNSQSPEKYYYAKIQIERKLKGMYLGSYYTENLKPLDFYVKTLDKPNTKLKEFKIIGTDYQSKQVKIENLSPEEATSRGLRFFDAEDFDNAFKYLKANSSNKKFQKNSNATFAMGYMYFWGRGTERSDEEMVKWLELSAKQNNLYALHYLGENYFYGEYGVEEDEKKALRMIKEAARKGFVESQYFLGEKNEKGEGGLKPDRKDAIRWYKKAAKQGDARAKAALKRLNEKE